MDHLVLAFLRPTAVASPGRREAPWTRPARESANPAIPTLAARGWGRPTLAACAKNARAERACAHRREGWVRRKGRARAGCAPHRPLRAPGPRSRASYTT